MLCLRHLLILIILFLVMAVASEAEDEYLVATIYIDSNHPVIIETAKSVLDYPSGQLFLLAARRHQPDFDINNSDLKYLARICLLTDGMPLALELATTWINSLPLSEISDEIQKNFDFLSTALRNIPYRHRSLRAVIDVSWERLSPNQKKISVSTKRNCWNWTGESDATPYWPARSMIASCPICHPPTRFEAIRPSSRTWSDCRI